MEVQIFGRVINVNWVSHDPAVDEPAKHVGKPINVDVATSTLEKFGRPEGEGAAKAEKEEAEKAYKGLGAEEKYAMILEIDRRYYESMEETPGTKIKSGEEGKAVHLEQSDAASSRGQEKA